MPIPFNVKAPTSHYAIGLDLVDVIPDGRTLSSCTCSARRFSDGTDATSTILNGTTATLISGMTVAAIALKSGGTSGTLYEVMFVPTLDDGQVLAPSIYRVMVDS